MALIEALYPLTEISRLRRRYDDDFVDRLSNRYSLFIFVIIGVFVTMRQYVGDPIQCWAPNYFPAEWIEYTNQVCWISNTYWVPDDERLPSSKENKSNMIAYYQWVPIMIFLQAMLFFLPSIIWKKMNCRSGIHVNKIVEVVSASERASPEYRDKTINYIVRNLDRALLSQNEYRRSKCAKFLHKISNHCFLICGKRYGNYLISLYLLTKLLYLTNSVGQMFLLNLFLGGSFYMFYGFEVLKELATAKPWATSRRFPRVTYCDFDIRVLGDKIHEYTVQCALPINLFNEKIFLFVWFWLVLISVLIVLNTAGWMWTLFKRNRVQYVRKYLKIMQRNSLDKKNKATAELRRYGPSKEFCEEYLKQDGIFVLRLIADNTNDVVVGEVIQALWTLYHERRKNQQKLDNENKRLLAEA